jgi:C-methyltransferase
MVAGKPGTAAQQQPHEIIRTLATAVVPSRCLCLAAELAVADQIADRAVSVDELASKCGAEPDALDRVLRLLASYGIFHRDGHAYAHTSASRLLRSDHPLSMRALCRMLAMPLFSTAFSNLEHSVRTGAPAVDVLEPNGIFTYLQDHPDEAQTFARAMSAKAGADIAVVLAAYDFSRFGTIADIGGGRGHLVRAVLEATPGAKGVLFDLPAVIETLDIQHERLTRQAGDFFVDPLPAADAYLLMDVLHDWDDDQCAAILGAIHRSAAPGATVLVIENVRTDEQGGGRGGILDVIMLAVTGGRERTASEFNRLFNRTGFSDGTITNTAGPLRIVEARQVSSPGVAR